MRIAWKPVGWGLFAVLVLTVLAGGLAARYFWNQALEQNGIESLEWLGLDLSFSGVTIRELTLTQSIPERDLALHGRNVSLGWRWPEWGGGWQPQLATLTAEYLWLDLYTKPVAQSETAPGVQQPIQWQPELLALLPSEVSVQQFDVTLPCETGRCPLAGSLALNNSHEAQVTEAQVQLHHEGHQLGLLATLDRAGRDNLNLSAELSIDGVRYLSAHTAYSTRSANDLVSWQGSVDVPELPRADWLLAWLQTWQNIPMEQWPDQPKTGSAAANWQLQGPGDETFLAKATGSVKVQARLPQPWPAPGIGTISGNAEVALKVDEGIWQPETLQADLKLSHPASWIKSIPELMRPELLELSVRPAKALPLTLGGAAATQAGAEPALLPLTLAVTSRGGANLAINSHLAASTSPPWRVQLGDTQITAALRQLDVAGWRLTKPKVEATLTGWLDDSAVALEFGKRAFVEAEKLEPLPGTAAATGGTQLNGLRVDLSGATLKAVYRREQGELSQLSLIGPLGIKAKQIRHPQLQPQPWQLDSHVNATLDRTDVKGLLKAKAGTSVNLDLKFPYDGLLSLEANMRVSGKSEVEALSRIFAAWPESLLVSGGNVSAYAKYERPRNGSMHLAGKLVFADWSGTYDRTAWTKMNGATEFFLENERVKVATTELTVEEVNPGLPFGPVLLAGHYQAPLAQLAAGVMTLEQASSGALSGEVNIQPGSWNLAQAPVTIPVELHQLSLAHLLQLYPTEGLAGTGILSGTVPVLFDPATGIRVERGRIDALKPGGRLKVTAERLKALASQSESMKLVARALEDFRYSVLDSAINYDENGTLILELHLEGNSPEVGKGQPVVLNINLEENIPALLTSLQLSGRVSDAVAERVKSMLKKRERDSDDLLE
ncbi:YdbH domain-containing protein [Marinobacter sp. 1-3A]|uniref:intermembrane phospholipid transport protein YdbH family protein n=1 Tax=Marinobacter sp. 1-3A TaxID=2582920 RepID=UPI0019030B26|nr:YdbH domain-containing protein [Marinobacter sp. 1-3A]MBK1872010.1 YdbH domain-containing protein [Marinobacter sp. 1-3A]